MVLIKNRMIRNKLLRYRKNKLLKESLFYTLINVLDRAIPFLLLPIITRLLPETDVGIYVTYQAVYLIFIPLVTFSLQNAIILNYYKLDENDFRNYFSSTYLLFIVLFCCAALIAFFFSNKITSLIEIPDKALFVLISVVFLFFTTDLRASLWRNQHKILRFGQFQIGLTLFKNSTGLILIYFFNFGWEGIIYGHLLSYFIFALIAIISFIKEKLFGLDSEIILTNFKDALKISLPLSLHSLSAWFGSSINRLIITDKMGVNYTAKFGIGSTFYTISTVIFDALNKAYAPNLFDKLSENNKSKITSVRNIIYSYYLAIIFITVCIAFVGYFTVGLIFGEEYESTQKFLIPLTASSALNGLYKLHVNFIFFQKQTYKVLFISITSGILNIPIATYLIVQYGLVGAAYAMLLTNTLYYLLSLILSHKIIKSKI